MALKSGSAALKTPFSVQFYSKKAEKRLKMANLGLFWAYLGLLLRKISKKT